MARNNTITVNVTLKWWFKWVYLPCLVGFCYFAQLLNIDAEPNITKVEKWLKKGLKFKIKKDNI